LYITCIVPSNKIFEKLASEEASLYPLAADVISCEMYVDDHVRGSDNLSDARRLQEELIHILGKESFVLYKWCDNYTILLEVITEWS
jgi:hypothetical protein